MIRALYTGSSGLTAQTALVDNTANNLANVNTTGYKRSLVDFQDLFYTSLRVPGTEVLQNQQVPTGIQVGNGARVAGITKVFTAGTFENTGNSLDVAIEGVGFFQVNAPDGTQRYTRDGSFQIDANNNLVTTDGFQIQPAITIPRDALSVTIGTDGTVSAITAANPTTPQTIGTLQLARFVNPAGLSAEGRNLFRQTPASGDPVLAQPGQQGLGLLRAGFLERSNVETVQELVSLIVAQRAFEANTRTIRTADQMLASANDLVR